MSYDELRQAHAEHITRVRAALDGNDPNTTLVAKLSADLAAANARVQELKAQIAEFDTLRRFYRDIWTEMPTGALFDYWDGSEAVTPDAKFACDELGEWISRVQNTVRDMARLSGNEVQP